MPFTTPPTRTDGVHTVTAADHNTYVRDNGIELDARKRVDYVESAASATVSATTAATANTILTAAAFTPSGTDAYRIEFVAAHVSVAGNAGGNFIVFHLYDGATNLGRIGVLLTTGTTQIDTPVAFSREFIPSNASHTFSIRAHRQNANCTVVHGAGGADVVFPHILRITRLP